MPAQPKRKKTTSELPIQTEKGTPTAVQPEPEKIMPEQNGSQTPPETPAAQATAATPAAATPGAPAAMPAGEWAASEPTPKRMGLIRLTLDRGVRTTVVGTVYGLDFDVEGEGHNVRIFFDYYSSRLKVLDYDATNYKDMVHRLDWLARANDFDKIFLKASKNDWQIFLQYGYVLEGILKYYFKGEDAFIMSKFISPTRISSGHLIEESEIIEGIMQQPRKKDPPALPKGYRMELATPDHIPGLVALYRQVFETYPSPLTHPDYILQTMERNVVYRIIVKGKNDIVSAASAEIDEKHLNAELTDCATKSNQRGKGLVHHILRALEDDLRERGIMTGYTLARARSVGMNRVFYRLGYEYMGRLVNNCDIYGELEDMNIWVKRL